MTELTLRGVHEDEEHLLLTDGAGNDYLLPIDESLYAAVRRDRTRLAQIRAADEPVRPKDIQALIRSGMTAEEVAQATGATLEHIRVYEGPVLAERAHTAHRAGRCLVYPENDPSGEPKQLTTLCEERLRMRDVDLGTMDWDAWKKDSGTWYVQLRFVAAGKERAAGWEYARGSISPLDDEARWLSDAGPSDSGPIPNFGTGSERVYNIEADEGRTQLHEESPRGNHLAETDRILESLRRRRGRHATTAAESPDDLGEHGRPQHAPVVSRHGVLHAVPEAPARQPDGAHTALSAPEEARDAGVFPLPAEPGSHGSQRGDHGSQRPEPGFQRVDAETGSGGIGKAQVADGRSPVTLDERSPAAPDEYGVSADQLSLLDEPGVSDHNATQPIPRPEDADAPRKKGRSSVPSWEEIMFGSKRD